MSKKLKLPRVDKEGFPYLSYSQYKKWKEKNRDYIRQYFFKEKEDNPALKKYGDFGHKVGESFEHANFSAWDKEEADFLQKLPYYDEFEKEVKLQLKGFYVLGYIDSNKSDYTQLLDYKTGDIVKMTPEYKSDKYEQVDLYAAALKQMHGKLPKKGIVVLIGRSGNAFNGEELNLTLEAEIINKPLSLKRCKEVSDNFQQIGEEISNYYRVFLKLIGKDE